MRDEARETAAGRRTPFALLLLAALLAAALPGTSPAAPISPVPSRDQLAHGLSALARAGALTAAEYASLAQRAGLAPTPSPAAELRHCGTVELLQVRGWAISQGVRVRDIPAPEPSGTLTSSRFPITVNYRTGENSRAAALVSATEQAWQRQVVELGYPAPWTMDDSGAARQGVVVGTDDSTDYGGVTIPQGNVDQTERCDCAMRIVISSYTSSQDLVSVVGHEFNHATQFATDCGETISAFENFATAVEFVESGRHDDFTRQMIGEFQSYPEYSVDYWTDNYDGGTPNQLYQYGASLWPLFLLDRFGNHDPVFLRKLWDSFAQDGFIDMSFGMPACSMGNAPNWFEGIDVTLQQQGSNFAAAFGEFAVWRAIVGGRDDGKHFVSGSRIQEPEYTGSLSLADTKTVTGDAFEYGTRYLLLSHLDAAMPVTLEVKGDPEASWAGAVILWRDNATESLPLAFQSNVGTLKLDSLAGVTRAIIAVSQLADDSHSPDEYDWQANRTFTLKATGPSSSVPGGDNGTAGAAPAAAGCSCSASAGAAALPELAMLLGLGLALRRRR